MVAHYVVSYIIIVTSVRQRASMLLPARGMHLRTESSKCLTYGAHVTGLRFSVSR
jgi:hypothetical protein